MSADGLSSTFFRLPGTMDHGAKDPARENHQPARDPARQATESAAAISSKDLALLVGGPKGLLLQLRTQVAESVRDIIAVQTALSDAIMLAADQIQDKRIDWLEEGPEVSFEAFVFELMLGFALDSAFAGQVLGGLLTKAFPYARNKDLAKQAGVVKAELEALQKEKGQLARVVQQRQATLKHAAVEVERAQGAASAARAEAQSAIKQDSPSIVGGFLTDEFHELNSVATHLEKELVKKRKLFADQQRLLVEAEKALGEVSTAELRQGRDLGDLEVERLAEWFKLNQPLVTNSVAALKALRGAKKSIPSDGSESAHALDSFGVQLKRQGLVRLRCEEDYLRGIMDTADALVAVGLATEALIPVCVARLQKIAHLLSASDIQEPSDERETEDAMLFFERLMWALLYADKFDTGMVQSGLRFVADVGVMGAAEQPLTEEVTARFSRRMLKYWQQRFFPTWGGGIEAEVAIVKQMRALRDGYLEIFRQNADASLDPVKMLLAPRPKP